jgi:hypothetical protein
MLQKIFEFLLRKLKFYEIWWKWTKLSFNIIDYHKILLNFMKLNNLNLKLNNLNLKLNNLNLKLNNLNLKLNNLKFKWLHFPIKFFEVFFAKKIDFDVECPHERAAGFTL